MAIITTVQSAFIFSSFFAPKELRRIEIACLELEIYKHGIFKVCQLQQYIFLNFNSLNILKSNSCHAKFIHNFAPLPLILKPYYRIYQNKCIHIQKKKHAPKFKRKLKRLMTVVTLWHDMDATSFSLQ